MGSACSVKDESATTETVTAADCVVAGVPDVIPSVDSTHHSDHDGTAQVTLAAPGNARATAMRKRLSADPSDFRSTVRRGELQLPTTMPSGASSVASDGGDAAVTTDAPAPMTERRETLAVFAAAAAEYQRAMEERWGTTFESTASPVSLHEKGTSASAPATTTEAQQATQRWSVQLSERGGGGLRSPRRRTTLFTEEGVPIPSSQRSSTTTTASSLISSSSLVRSGQDSFAHAHSPTGVDNLPHVSASIRVPHDMVPPASPRHPHSLPPLPTHSHVGEILAPTDDGDDEQQSPTM